MTAAAAGERTGTFIATKEHRRFAEFADAEEIACHINGEQGR